MPLDSLCRALRDILAVCCPDRAFRVWGLIQLHGTMLVRFHQDWPDEEPCWPEDMEPDAAQEAMVFYKT